MPNSPLNAAGIRIDPAPSEPSATPHSPAAAAAPEPPLDPPGVSWVFHGLREAPNETVSVNGQIVSSGTFVFPMMIAPASRRRAHDVGVHGPRAGMGAAAPAGRLAGDVRVVLDRDGHPQQRPLLAGAAARVGLVGLGERALGEDDAVGVERRIDAGDALERCLDDLAGRDLSLAHHPGLLRRAGVGEIGGVHGAGEH